MWAGQPVALVVAETAEAAADAVQLVQRDAEPLAPVIDLDVAVAPDADRARVGREVVPLEASAESQHAAVGAEPSNSPRTNRCPKRRQADRLPAWRCRGGASGERRGR